MNDPHDRTVLTADENAVMVLMVDDQAMIGEAVRRDLANQENIDFHFCADPQQALALAIQIRPTVILQDLIMPGVDGLTLVRDYRSHPATRDIPIIVLSTKEDPAVKSAAFAAGANDYLVKLPDAIELVARIRYHSRSYLTLLQRDEAYRALRESQQRLLDTNLVLQRLMNSDGLTGLSNRRHFDEYFDLEWRRAQREQAQLSVMLFDVDYFKSYNDDSGHLAGDEALRQVAIAMRESCSRPADLAARYGGDEFVIVLPATPSAGARLVAEKIRAAVQARQIPHSSYARGACLTLSIGVATLIPKQGESCQLLIQLADQGLYSAKNQGRNRVGMLERPAAAG
ncbi:MAG: diguanylate cyclase domain-containing protein [Pseudomonas sp.]